MTRKQKKKRNTFKFFLLLFILLLASFVSFFIYKNSQNLNGKISSDEVRNSLQIDQYSPLAKNPEPNKTSKPIPDSPGKQCTAKKGELIKYGEMKDKTSCSCVGHAFTDNCDACNCINSSKNCIELGAYLPGEFPHKDEAGEPPEGARFWCDAKPIIYLYPETPTYVDVTVEVPGEIVVSDPLYPPGGWKQVFAEPDGSLTYQGKTYKELFYEASITPIDKPKNGIVIPDSLIQETLNNFVTKLGLIGNEKKDFLSFWVPKLKNLNDPYIHISVFSHEQKQKIDRVIVSPQPDTFIEFIMYYKPLKIPISVEPFIFPKLPERKGFTAVEWGGIIDN